MSSSMAVKKPNKDNQSSEISPVKIYQLYSPGDDGDNLSLVFANDQTPTPTRTMETLQDLNSDKLLPHNPFDLAFRSALSVSSAIIPATIGEKKCPAPALAPALLAKDSLMTPVPSVCSNKSKMAALTRADTIELSDEEDEGGGGDSETQEGETETNRDKASLFSMPTGLTALMRMDSNKSYSDINDITISPVPLTSFTDSFTAAATTRSESKQQLPVLTSAASNNISDHQFGSNYVLMLSPGQIEERTAAAEQEVTTPIGQNTPAAGQWAIVQVDNGSFQIVRLDSQTLLAGLSTATEQQQSNHQKNIISAASDESRGSSLRQSVIEALRKRCGGSGGGETPSHPSTAGTPAVKRKRASEDAVTVTSSQDGESTNGAHTTVDRRSSSHSSEDNGSSEGRGRLMAIGGEDEEDSRGGGGMPPKLDQIRERNRAAAQRCRMKKKEYIHKLERRCRELEAKCREWETHHASLTTENLQLKQILLERKNQPPQLMRSLVNDKGEEFYIMTAPSNPLITFTTAGLSQKTEHLPGPSNVQR